jgi:hypothetical protein
MDVTKIGVVIRWQRPDPASIPTGPERYRLRIFRRAEGAAASINVCEVDYEAAEQAGEQSQKVPNECLDQSFEWEKTYFYHSTVVTVVRPGGKPAIQIEGEDSPEIKVVAHDTFPPTVPSGVQAVFSGPGQEPFIDVIWAPVADADLAGYNVYRHEQGISPAKISTEPVKTPAYRDTNVVSGKTYFYSVSAVDLRGNESPPSEETSEKVP